MLCCVQIDFSIIGTRTEQVSVPRAERHSAYATLVVPQKNGGTLFLHCCSPCLRRGPRPLRDRTQQQLTNACTLGNSHLGSTRRARIFVARSPNQSSAAVVDSAAQVLEQRSKRLRHTGFIAPASIKDSQPARRRHPPPRLLSDALCARRRSDQTPQMARFAWHTVHHMATSRK